MEKMSQESLEKIMKEIEATTEKKTLELLQSSDGKTLTNFVEKKAKETLGVLPKIDESTSDSSGNTLDLNQDFGKKLMEIMGEGDKEFQKRTGRRMTYGEMRSLYG
jgi:hypothetical protein